MFNGFWLPVLRPSSTTERPSPYLNPNGELPQSTDQTLLNRYETNLDTLINNVIDANVPGKPAVIGQMMAPVKAAVEWINLKGWCVTDFDHRQLDNALQEYCRESGKALAALVDFYRWHSQIYAKFPAPLTAAWEADSLSQAAVVIPASVGSNRTPISSTAQKIQALDRNASGQENISNSSTDSTPAYDFRLPPVAITSAIPKKIQSKFSRKVTPSYKATDPKNEQKLASYLNAIDQHCEAIKIDGKKLQLASQRFYHAEELIKWIEQEKRQLEPCNVENLSADFLNDAFSAENENMKSSKTYYQNSLACFAKWLVNGKFCLNNILPSKKRKIASNSMPQEIAIKSTSVIAAFESLDPDEALEDVVVLYLASQRLEATQTERVADTP